MDVVKTTRTNSSHTTINYAWTLDRRAAMTSSFLTTALAKLNQNGGANAAARENR